MYLGYIIVACSILCEVVKLIRELILKYLIIIKQYVESIHLISSIASSNVMIVSYHIMKMFGDLRTDPPVNLHALNSSLGVAKLIRQTPTNAENSQHAVFEEDCQIGFLNCHIDTVLNTQYLSSSFFTLLI